MPRSAPLAALLSLSLLSACATDQAKTSPPIGSAAPTVPTHLCPASLKAPSEAEPAAPAGIDEAAAIEALTMALGADGAQALWKYLTVTHRDWAHEGWRRVDQARVEDCTEGGAR